MKHEEKITTGFFNKTTSKKPPSFEEEFNGILKIMDKKEQEAELLRILSRDAAILNTMENKPYLQEERLIKIYWQLRYLAALAKLDEQKHLQKCTLFIDQYPDLIDDLRQLEKNGTLKATEITELFKALRDTYRGTSQYYFWEVELGEESETFQPIKMVEIKDNGLEKYRLNNPNYISKIALYLLLAWGNNVKLYDMIRNKFAPGYIDGELFKIHASLENLLQGIIEQKQVQQFCVLFYKNKNVRDPEKLFETALHLSKTEEDKSLLNLYLDCIRKDSKNSLTNK